MAEVSSTLGRQSGLLSSVPKGMEVLSSDTSAMVRQFFHLEANVSSRPKDVNCCFGAVSWEIIRCIKNASRCLSVTQRTNVFGQLSIAYWCVRTKRKPIDEMLSAYSLNCTLGIMSNVKPVQGSFHTEDRPSSGRTYHLIDSPLPLSLGFSLYNATNFCGSDVVVPRLS